jgi:exonuclease III
MNWNIQSGGEKRIERILEHLETFNVDIIVLTEYRNNDNGLQIQSLLEKKGFPYRTTGVAERSVNSVLIASRERVVPELQHIASYADNEHAMAVSVNGFSLLSVFCTNDDVTESFISHVSANSTEWLSQPFLITGDLNAGPGGSNPDRYDGLQLLADTGWIDGWRELNDKPA